MKPSLIAQGVEQLINIKQPFFVKGPVGAGKSEIMMQVCEKLDIEFRDVRLSQMDPTDIKGFPCPDAANGVMRWLPADFLPTPGKKDAKGKMQYTNGGPRGLLFLDELPSAPQAVQAAAYQLVLDRKVGSYTLPPGWAIGSAGNRDIDRSIVNRMPAALANRLIHLDFEVDIEDFVTHAMNKGLEPELIAFLRFKSNMLHSFDPQKNPMAFPTPRTWFFADRIIKAKMAQMLEYELLRGCVGEGAAGELAAFLSTIKDLPTIDEIKLNPDKTEIPKSPSVLHALTTTLAMSTDEAAFDRFMIYVKRMPTEFQVVYVRDVLRRESSNKVKFLPTFTKWSLANADVVL